jgi:hypothetical protein
MGISPQGATVTENQRATVSGFGWALAASGARSGCSPASGQGGVAAA